MFKDIRATIELDITKSEEELLSKIDKDAKWGIKKAEKEGLLFEESKSEEDWELFYKIYKKTIMAGGIKPDSFEDLKKENRKLFIAKKDGKTIAGAIIEIEDNEKFKLEYNASLQNFLKMQPNNLLYWNLILWGKKNNFKVFDLGGYQISARDHLSGVNRFKERWGGEIKQYPVYSWNPAYILGRKVIRNMSFIKRKRDLIKLKLYENKESYKRNSISRIGFSSFLRKLFNRMIFKKGSVLIYSSSNSEYKKTGQDVIEIKDLGDWIFESLDRELAEDRLLEGERLFAIVNGKKVLHSSWVKFNHMNISEAFYKIDLDKGEACIYDSYTSAESRGKGLYPAMLQELSQQLKAEGFSKIYIYVEDSNSSSIRGIEKAGFIKEKIISYFMLLGMKKVSVKNG